MSRIERVESLLRQIEDETRIAFDEHTQLYHRAQSLESENAKLRELALDMWRPASYQVTGFQYNNFKERMRELGVEVDR